MDDYEIQMDGEFHQFESGATRYTKTGKGRPELIPHCVLDDFLQYVETLQKEKKLIEIKPLSLEREFVVRNYYNCILILTITFYAEKFSYNTCDFAVAQDAAAARQAIAKMLLELSIHFEKGAEKYGERNCEKGIPIASFEQSAMRHTMQSYAGLTNENHPIAAIWNLWMAQFNKLNNIG